MKDKEANGPCHQDEARDEKIGGTVEEDATEADRLVLRKRRTSDRRTPRPLIWAPTAKKCSRRRQKINPIQPTTTPLPMPADAPIIEAELLFKSPE